MSTKPSQAWKHAFLSSRYERFVNFLICSFSSSVKVIAGSTERERETFSVVYKVISGRYSPSQSLTNSPWKTNINAGLQQGMMDASALRRALWNKSMFLNQSWGLGLWSIVKLPHGIAKLQSLIDALNWLNTAPGRKESKAGQRVSECEIERERERKGKSAL